MNDSLTVPHFWWVIRSQLLIFGEWSDCSSHSSLKQSGRANCLFFKTYKKTNKKTILYKYFWVNRSFFVSERAIHSEKTSDSLRLLFYHEGHEHLLTVALFWWVTWVNCSWLHIFGEQPERFAHSCSFLSWAIWANCSQLLFKMSHFEQKSDEQMSKFPTLVVPLGANQGWEFAYLLIVHSLICSFCSN